MARFSFFLDLAELVSEVAEQLYPLKQGVETSVTLSFFFSPNI